MGDRKSLPLHLRNSMVLSEVMLVGEVSSKACAWALFLGKIPHLNEWFCLKVIKYIRLKHSDLNVFPENLIFVLSLAV